LKYLDQSSFFKNIKNIDILFLHLSEMDLKKKISRFLLNELSGKKYCSCIKYRYNSQILRTKIYSSSQTILMNKEKKKIDINALKPNMRGIFKIKLSAVWFYQNMYGITWTLLEGNLV